MQSNLYTNFIKRQIKRNNIEYSFSLADPFDVDKFKKHLSLNKFDKSYSPLLSTIDILLTDKESKPISIILFLIGLGGLNINTVHLF